MGRALGALTGVAGPLLAVGLLAAASDLAPVLGVGGSATTLGQLVTDHVVDQVFLDVDIEDVVGNVPLGHLLVLYVIYSDLRHG